MTDLAISTAPGMTANGGGAAVHTSEAARRRLKARYAAEWRFKAYGIAAITFALVSLAFLLFTILGNGATAFQQTFLKLPIEFTADVIDPDGKRVLDEMRRGDYAALIRVALNEKFPEVNDRQGQRQLVALMSAGAGDQLRDMVMTDPSVVGQKRDVWLYASSDVDMLNKGYIDRNTPEADRRVNDRQIEWVEKLKGEGAVERKFNSRFFTGADSREPELVGVWGSVVGSFWLLLITLIVALPLGILAAIYLEEFAPKNRFTDLIEVNINNLAAVPSIVFGLLGLAVFIGFFGMPRSVPLVGGLVIALGSLPVIIIAARASIRAVPPSIREAALGVGASKVQTVMHHVLPLAMPGILTGTIIAMGQALGETAPLLMIGMVAFLVDIPSGPLQASTVLPVQIYMWADSAERGFVEKTSAGIMVLLAFLLAMNAIAIILRKRFERRW
jgi:phosphate transport system permease protein